MELYQLRYFNTLCKFHSADRAAESLFISSSTLMSALRKLEQEIGTPLRRRSGSSYELTDAGMHLFEVSERVLSELDSLNSSVESGLIASTFIRFGIGVELCSPTFLREIFSFQETQEYAFRISRMGGDRVRDHVLSGKSTIGLVIAQPNENTSLNVSTVRLVEYGLYTYSSHWLSRARVIDPSDLKGQQLTLLNFSGDLRAPLSSFFSKKRVMVSSSNFVNPFYSSAVKYIAREMGIAIFPLGESLPAGVSVSRFDPPLLLRHIAISRKGAERNKIMQDFANHLRKIDSKGGDV